MFPISSLVSLKFLLVSPIPPLPGFILVPALFAFPSLPITLYLFIGNSLVPRWNSAIAGRELQNGSGNAGWSGMDPWSVIGERPEPMPLMGTIPMAAIEQNVQVNIRNDIYIGSGYHHHGRRGMDHDWRGSANAYIQLRGTDAYIDFRNRIRRCAKAD
jgi:hypothetical protein